MKRIALALLVLVAGGCATWTPITATAVMEPRNGSEVRGTVTFTQLEEEGALVSVDLTGVPEGVHGFHVHETGDCSAPDATSAGGHFNPLGAPHAGPGDPQHHAGDFGNVIAPASGVVKARFALRSISLVAGDETNAIGRAVIVHAKRDDLTTQPAGDAGGRIACGVITLTAAP